MIFDDLDDALFVQGKYSVPLDNLYIDKKAYDGLSLDSHYIYQNGQHQITSVVIFT